MIAFSQMLIAGGNDKDLPTVAELNIERYLGKWFEIARFEQKSQEGCTAVTAEYSFRDDGNIKVLNSCRVGNSEGELEEAEGRAWIKDSEIPSRLKVQCFLRWFRIGWFAGDYFVVALDDNYQFAMVGAPDRDYLWILSRTPELSKDVLTDLISYAAS